MGGGNEFVECLGGGGVAEGGSGAVARLVGDGVEVGVVAGMGVPLGRPWMRRVSAPDLIGFPTQGQGHDDQVAGRVLNQARCLRWPRLGR